MPITALHTKGDWGPKSKRYKYSPVDIGILSSPKGREKIIKKWSNSKNEFEMYFLKSYKASKFVEEGEVSSDWVKQNLEEDIEAKNDVITVIFTNNVADEKVPMDYWTIAHRFGHAIERNKTFNIYMRKEISKDFKEILEYVYGIKENFDWKLNEKYNKAIFTAVGKMGSTRNNKLRNSNEFAHELVAQYIITGKIEFNDLPKNLIVDRKMAWGRPNYKTIRVVDDVAYTEYNEMIKSHAVKYEYNLDSIFSGLEGKIFVM